MAMMPGSESSAGPGSVSYDTQRPKLLTPTMVHYAEFQRAFDWYNQRLFEPNFGQILPNVLIVMTRKSKTHGYVAPNRWVSAEDGETLHELGLNPVDFAEREIEQILSTLVHEMCHVWQVAYGEKVPRKNYHNREWAEAMAEIGLIASNTGEPGGKQVGQGMTHYIDDGGEFTRATAALLDRGWTVPHLDIPEDKAKKKNNRPKYCCTKCEVQAWAKSGTLLFCGSCAVALEEQQPDEEEAGSAGAADPENGTVTGDRS